MVNVGENHGFCLESEIASIREIAQLRTVNKLHFEYLYKYQRGIERNQEDVFQDVLDDLLYEFGPVK